ncbi:MAG: response regulator [Bacteroidales bacterium]|nr:response regulator [Bacteroidales bacterium]
MANIKILLVDDDPDLIIAVQTILENKGYEVVAAYNKKEGLELLLTEKPDLAILDVMMEGTHDGFELARAIKQIPEYEKLPIIMLTSVDSITGVNFKAAMSDPNWLPADEYIDKPVEPNDLIETIEQVLAAKADKR